MRVSSFKGVSPQDSDLWKNYMYIHTCTHIHTFKCICAYMRQRQGGTQENQEVIY